MELLTLVQVVLRRWWLVLLLGVLGVACAYLAVSAVPKRYQSAVSLQLNPAAKSAFLPYNGTTPDQPPSAVATLAASYSEVLRSRTFNQLVIDRLHLPVSPEVLGRAIDARLIPSTNILRLNVIWDNPQDATLLAQSIAELFITENVQQAQNGTTQRIQQLQDSARQMQTRQGALQQQRDRLDEAVSRGDLSRLNDLNDLDTRLAALQTSYTNALVEVDRAQSGLDTAAIVDNATPGVVVGGLAPIQGFLLGLLIGLGVGTCAALLLDKLVSAINGPEDIAAVSGSPPLAAIGRIRGSKTPTLPGLDPRLVVVSAPRSASAEAFRTLRANLRLSALEHPLRTIVVTSAGVSEGKTFVSTNLAVALAQSGKRVLLVDADLRRPTAHRLLGLTNSGGLVEALLHQSEQAHLNGHDATETPSLNAYAAVPTAIDGLSLLPSGSVPHNPSEILGSEVATHLLQRLANDFDIVVIDTPPIGPVADALLLGARADGILVVARAGQTRQDALRGALDALQTAGKPILGIVMNDLRPTPLSRYSTYRYYYTGYYGNHYYLQDDNDGKKNNNNSGSGERPHTNGVAVTSRIARDAPSAQTIASPQD